MEEPESTQTYTVTVHPHGLTSVDALEPGQSTLEHLQSQVGGYVYCIELHDSMDAWINDEGTITGADPNPVGTSTVSREAEADCMMLRGPVIFTANPDAEGNTQGLSKDQTTALLATITEESGAEQIPGTVTEELLRHINQQNPASGASSPGIG